MGARARDRLAGAILFGIALAWIAGVFWTIPIPDAAGARLGPRTFPAAMGGVLAFLSLLLIASTLFGVRSAEPAPAAAEARAAWWALVATFGFLLGHLLLLIWFGFVVGTVLATAAFLWLVLRERLPRLLIGLPLGITFGIWLVLGKLMGVYLPHGSLLDLF